MGCLQKKVKQNWYPNDLAMYSRDNNLLQAQKKERHTVARVYHDVSKRAEWIVAFEAESSMNAFTLVEQ